MAGLFAFLCQTLSRTGSSGNSVVVPVFEAVAKLLEPYILKAVNADSCKVERI